MSTGEHPYAALAREAIRHYLATGRIVQPDSEPDDPVPTGVFVSLHYPAKRGQGEGALRGCVGTIRPKEPTLRGEIARSAVSAAVSDPRFPPLAPGETDRLDITVYLLGEPEEVDGLDDLDPERYGVIVEGPGGRTGLLLPAIPGILTAASQVEIARSKASIHADDPIRLSRFSATILH